MNKYKISYSMFQIVDGNINSSSHFSNCISCIEGDTFNDAKENFKKLKLIEGWYVDFITEGSIFEIKFS